MRPVERLAVIGVSHTNGGSSALEAWHLAYPDVRAVAAVGFDEVVSIATCNRFEAVVVLPQGMDCAAARNRLTPAGTDPAARKAYAYRGEAALEHLARVATSLDSLNPGEDQIMRQVRAALAAAQAAGTTGSVLEFAFSSALKAAKRVRREVPLAPVNVSLFSLALPRLRPHLAPGTRVAVLGAGKMARLAAQALLREQHDLELLIVNRGEDRGRALALQVAGDWSPLDDFLAEPSPQAILVSATPRAGLVDAELAERIAGLRIVLDLGMPRNVSSDALAGTAIELVDIESLRRTGQERREAIGERLAEAEAVVSAEIEVALDAWTDRQLAPTIVRLRQLYRDTIGDGLPAEQAERLAHRFAHVPVMGLRALARRYGVEAATTFLAETERA